MYIRKCPKCNSDIIHKGKHNCINAEKDGKLCKKCMHSGKSQKDMYGDKYEEIIEKRSTSLKKVNHWWQEKIVESRKINGTYVHTKEYKDWLSKNSVFNDTGKNHVKIKKILKEKNISYEEYLDKFSAYQIYHKLVRYLTNKQDLKSLKYFNKRGKCGVKGAYQLDHIIEISEGFVNNIDATIIADIKNLQFIPWEENIKKRKYPGGIIN